MRNLVTYFKAVLAMLFWAFTFVWIKIALKYYHPIEIVFLRLVLATVLLFSIALIFKKSIAVKRKEFLHLMLVAFCEPFGYFLGEANGMQYVSPALGSLIISIIPLVTAVGAWFLLKEKVTKYVIIGLIISFIGVAVMSIDSPDLNATLKGIMLLLLAVFSGMFYGITVRSMTLKHDTMTIVTWQSFFGMLYFLPIFLIADGQHFFSMQHSFAGLKIIAAMSVFASIGSFMLYTTVIREVGIIKANVFTYLIPVFTLFLAYLILGDKITIYSGVGLVLVISGLLISQYRDIYRKYRLTFPLD